MSVLLVDMEKEKSMTNTFFQNINMPMSPHGRGNKSYGFLSTLFAKGEGLVLVKELRISLRNLKDYTYKIQKILTKMHLILTHFEPF